MITIIDNQTDEVLDEININDKILVAEHTQDAESKEETLDFTFRGHYEGIKGRNRLLIKDDDNQYREFVIENIEQTDDDVNVFSNASYLEDLNNAKPIEPGGKNGLTTGEWIEYALTGTDWKSGVVEFNGIRTINWTGYNNPYELLTIIANRFEMTLRFRVETDGTKVISRYVDLVKVNHLFNGKEIVRGKDLIEFKRSENSEEVATALIALGPQPEEGKERLMQIVVDDEANEKINKQGKYNWKIYEPQSEDQNMTAARLLTLARTELNKRKEPLIDYSIKAINLEYLYGHEKVRLYDKVRIKDEELNRYAEANTKKITRNLLDKTDREFVFGDIIEYERETLRSYFNSIINELKQRLENMPNTIDNIIEIVTDSELFERKISKSETPPDNPQEDDFWLDISDSEVGVLYRWENGKWVKSSVTQAEEIGAVTREAAMYDSLKNTLELLTMQHSNLMGEYYSIMENEYLVDNALKQSLTSGYNTADGHFNAVLTKFNSMTIDTATMGRLMETLELITNYRESLNTVRIRLVAAQQEIERYFALLQNQYTEEKYNGILNEVADKFGLDVVDGKLLGDSVFMENMEEIKTELQQQLDDARTEFEGIEYENRNLFVQSSELGRLAEIDDREVLKTIGYFNNSVELASGDPLVIKRDLISGATYTLSGRFDAPNHPSVPNHNAIYLHHENGRINVGEFPPNYENHSFTFRVPENLTQTFLAFDTGGYEAYIEKDTMKLERGKKATPYSKAPEDTDNKITNINQSLVNIEGQLKSTINQETFDLLNKTVTKQGTELEQTVDSLSSKADKTVIDTINNTVKEQGTLINQTAEELSLKANQKEFDTLNNTVSEQGTDININAQQIALRAKESDLDTVTGRVNKAEAGIEVNAREISSRVKEVDYETDKEGIIFRLSGAESSITQQSKLIESKVGSIELTQAIDNIKVGGRNIIPNSANLLDWSKWSLNTSVIKMPDGMHRVSRVNSTTGGAIGIHSKDRFVLKAGNEYTITYKAHDYYNALPNYIYILSSEQGNTQLSNLDIKLLGRTGTLVNQSLYANQYKLTFTFTKDVKDGQILIGYDGGTTSHPNIGFYISDVQLENGNQFRDWSPAPEDVDAKIKENENRIIKHDTQFEQTDKQLALRATMTDVNQSDETLSSAISELVINSTNGLKFNYDSNGRLASYSVGPDGIQFDGSKIIFNASDSIMLKISDAQKISNDAKAQADAARIGNNIAASLNLSGTTTAISGSKISLTGTAEFNSALGAARGITAIDGGRVETDSMRAKKVEIVRDDGAVSISDGRIKAEYGINAASPEFMSHNPTSNGDGLHFWVRGAFWVTNRTIQHEGTGAYGGRINYFEFLHTSRYLRVAIVANVANTGFAARIRNSSGTINEATSLAMRSPESDSKYNITRVLTADLGTPTYKRMNFYLYFMPNSQGGGADWAMVRIFHTMLTDEVEIPGWSGNDNA